MEGIRPWNKTKRVFMGPLSRSFALLFGLYHSTRCVEPKAQIKKWSFENSITSKVQRLTSMHVKLGMPHDLWFGRGKPPKGGWLRS